MCFSNLPVEFDDDGNPRLVDSDKEHGQEGDTVGDRATTDDGLDPEARYRDILDDLPDRVRDQFENETVGHSKDHRIAE